MAFRACRHHHSGDEAGRAEPVGDYAEITRPALAASGERIGIGLGAHTLFLKGLMEKVAGKSSAITQGFEEDGQFVADRASVVHRPGDLRLDEDLETLLQARDVAFEGVQVHSQ